MKVVLISGKAQHGKDTFATFVKNELEKQNLSSAIIHFGDAVKFVAREFFGWSGLKDEVGRSILQRVGTEVVRAKDEHFWTDFVARLSRTFDCDYIIIPDWRFEEEYSHMFNYFNIEDIVTVRINRYEKYKVVDSDIIHAIPFINGEMTKEQISHQSEVELDDFVCSYVVINTTLDELKESATIFVEELLTKE